MALINEETLSTSVDNGLNTGVKVGFDLIEETIDDVAQVINADPLCAKLHSNTLVTINRLPVELLIHIILFACKSIIFRNAHPYLSYTWVCHHWRTVLVQSPVFWTLIQSPPSPKHPQTFYQELFRRSKLSKLDVILSCGSDQPGTMRLLIKLFAENSSRIRRLRLANQHQKLIELVLSGRNLPSLRGLAFIDNYGPHDGGRYLPHLLPILATSDHLETLELTLRAEDWILIPKDQITSIFNRLRNLSLTVSGEIVESVFDLLHNNRKLQKLHVYWAFGSQSNNFSIFQATFPELQSLVIDDDAKLGLIVKNIRAPKLSSIYAFTATLDFPIMKDLDFSIIKNLTIRNYCPNVSGSWSGNGTTCWILGTKERIDHETLSIENTDILFEDYSVCEYPRDHETLSIEHIYIPFENYSVCECPRDYFHLKFGSFSPVLKEAFSYIIPQLTNLVELHLNFLHSDSLYEEILPLVPSIQELTVRPGPYLIDLLRLLSNPSQCPHLTHLTYTTFPLPKNREQYANSVGGSLTKCLQLRQDASPGDVLKYIKLKNLSSLPDIWVKELQGLSAEVIAEEDIKNPMFRKGYYDDMDV